MNRKATLTLLLCVLSWMAALAEKTQSDASAAIIADAPGAAFLQGEKLAFRLLPDTTVSWTLRNWQHKTISQGEAKSSLRLPALPNGYYTLELAGFTGSRSFAVVPDPADRQINPNQFFAMDSAQSWLARPDKNNPRCPENSFEVVSEVARRAGLSMVRERMHWGEIESQPGEFKWLQYGTNAELLSKRGVKVLGMYHYVPDWAKNEGVKLPFDLIATYRFARKAAETLHGKMTAWEFWNEQDIGFAPEPAWDYAAALKAAGLGFKAADPELPVAIGGYAITPLLPYADVVMQNGAADYFDIFNFHSYRPISDFPEVLKNVKEHMKRHGIESYPIWMTENGSAMEGGGAAESFIPGLKAHSPEQEMMIAEYIPKMMTTMQSLGVTRDFFFVLPPYSEQGGSKDWGLMRRDFTVKPGFAAFATLVEQLGDATLEGEVYLGAKLKGYLYRLPDGKKTLIYWSISELDTEKPKPNLSNSNLYEQEFSLPLSTIVHGLDLFGTPFTVEPARIPASRYPRFLNNVSLKADLPFQPPELAPRAEKKNFDKTIIFRTELSPDFQLFYEKDCTDIKRDNARFKLQIWNLSDQEKTGSVAISGGTVGGLPETIQLPPFGKKELELTFTPMLDREFKGELRADGVFEGNQVSPLVIPLQSLDAMSLSGRKQEMPQMLDPANWKKNSAGEMEIVYDENDQAITFTTDFPPGANRWSYPEYTLQLPQESLKGALGVELEVKVSNASAVMQMLLMAVPQTGKDVYLKAAPPRETFETRFIAFPPSLAPSQIIRLRLGVNALQDNITVSIRNIRVFYRR